MNVLFKALTCAAIFCGIHAYGQDAAEKCIRPPFLRTGDKVALVATSYQPTDTTVARACRVLREWGFVPVVSRNILENPIPKTRDTVRYYPGDVMEQVTSLKQALEDDSIKAMICTRGGYGAIHMLDSLPLDMFKAHPKWLVGYSDVTTLHCALVSSGVMSIHGEMCVSFTGKKGPDEAALKMRDLLMGDVPLYEIPANKYNSKGKASGVLVGGNMITMAALTGTRYDPAAHDGVILFIEEIEESMHAIDRLFNMLVLQKKLPNIKGIVFGEFKNCDRDLPFESVEHMLSQYTSKLGIPVCFGFPAGHGDINMPLVEGADVVLEVTDEGAELSFWL